MTLEARIQDRFRNRAKRFVARLASELGCKTKAVKEVAKRIGKSPAWLYRVMNEHRAPKAIAAHEYVALLVHSMEPPKKRFLPFGIFSAEKRKVPVFSKGVSA